MSLPLSTTYSHLHDSAVQFDAANHVYTVNGCSDYTSVTTWVDSLFPSFDPDLVITKMMASKKWPQSPYFGTSRQNIKDQWNNTGRKAALAGTAMHDTIEQFYNNLEIEIDCLELEYFMDFEKAIGSQMTPYRTEWRVWDSDLRIAGTVDMVFENPDKTLSLYDWKRCKQIKKDNPWESASVPGIAHLPNSNYWHYALQLNMYKFILEKNYQKKIKEMVLVCLHPNNTNQSFIRLEIPALDTEMKSLVNYPNTSAMISEAIAVTTV